MLNLMRIVWIIALLLSATSLAKAETISPVIAVIVNSDELKVANNELSLIYWRKQQYWPKGQRIKPVNLRSDHPLRQHFSQTVLGSPPKKQIDYWNGQYFNGILPPYTVNSEEAVLRYVAQTNGALGYVNACHVDNRVKAIMWIEQDQISTAAPENLRCP